jgi:hypothetical protein
MHLHSPFMKPFLTLGLGCLVLFFQGIDNALAAIYERPNALWGLSPVIQRPLTLPAGTRLWVMLTHPVTSSSARAGDVVEGLLLHPIQINGMRLADTGSVITGQVEAVDRYHATRYSGYVQFRFTSLKPQTTLPVLAFSAGVDTPDNTQGRLFGDRYLQQLHPSPFRHRLFSGYQTRQGLRLSDIYTALGNSGEITLDDRTFQKLLIQDDPYHALGVRWHIGQGVLTQGREIRLPTATPLPLVLDKPLTFSGEYLPRQHIPVSPIQPDPQRLRL